MLQVAFSSWMINVTTSFISLCRLKWSMIRFVYLLVHENGSRSNGFQEHYILFLMAHICTIWFFVHLLSRCEQVLYMHIYCRCVCTIKWCDQVLLVSFLQSMQLTLIIEICDLCDCERAMSALHAICNCKIFFCNF